MSVRKSRSFVGDRSGNVAMMFGLLAFPLVFAAGAGVDYGFAARTKDKLNAAADAAALAAVTAKMMTQTTAEAKTAATNAFNAHVAGIRGVTLDSIDIDVTEPPGATRTRTAKITYTARVNNAFARLYRQPTTMLKGESTSSATMAPNIDFYMLLDSSPSMAIAATTAGIEKMVANTSTQGGCAFGCHQTNPSVDKLGNPGGIDNYQLARNLGVALRIDNVRSAVQNLTTTAKSVMQTNKAKYRMAIYTFDVAFNTIIKINSNLDAVQSAASKIELLEVYKNNYLTSTNNNSDTDTNYDSAMSNINSIMPKPGSGTNVKGATPQGVLFLVTDGVEDTVVSSCDADAKCVSLGGGKLRQQYMMSNDWCTTVKDRNIRIAVLYTTYFPLPTNSWYNSYIKPFQSQIGPNMKNCASPELYFEVNTDQDISTAMNALFQKTVATAHLTK